MGGVILACMAIMGAILVVDWWDRNGHPGGKPYDDDDDNEFDKLS